MIDYTLILVSTISLSFLFDVVGGCIRPLRHPPPQKKSLQQQVGTDPIRNENDPMCRHFKIN